MEVNSKDREKFETITNKKCKCSHVVSFYKNDVVICKYCGRLHFINKKKEYEYYIKRRFKNVSS